MQRDLLINVIILLVNLLQAVLFDGLATLGARVRSWACRLGAHVHLLGELSSLLLSLRLLAEYNVTEWRIPSRPIRSTVPIQVEFAN